MKYLAKECPYCQEKKVLQPKGKFALCEGCGKHSRFVIIPNEHGARYDLRPVGQRGRNMVRATFWIEKWHKDALLKFAGNTLGQSEIVRRALTGYLANLEK